MTTTTIIKQIKKKETTPKRTYMYTLTHTYANNYVCMYGYGVC